MTTPTTTDNGTSTTCSTTSTTSSSCNNNTNANVDEGSQSHQDNVQGSKRPNAATSTTTITDTGSVAAAGNNNDGEASDSEQPVFKKPKLTLSTRTTDSSTTINTSSTISTPKNKSPEKQLFSPVLHATSPPVPYHTAHDETNDGDLSPSLALSLTETNNSNSNSSKPIPKKGSKLQISNPLYQYRRKTDITNTTSAPLPSSVEQDDAIGSKHHQTTDGGESLQEIKRDEEKSPQRKMTKDEIKTSTSSKDDDNDDDIIRPRQHRQHVTQLPFPRNIVGTYSCHGVQPLSDSEYEEPIHEGEDDDDDGDDEYINRNKKTSSSNSDDNVEDGDGNNNGGGLAYIPKINQDRAGVAFPYANCSRTAIFATFDGHGDGGEHVAQYALHEVPKRLEMHDSFKKWVKGRRRRDGEVKGDGDDGEKEGEKVGESSDVNKNGQDFQTIEHAFKDVFLSVDADLKQEKDIEPMYSGSTACVVLLRDNFLVCSNLGDSRAVLGCTTSSHSRFRSNSDDPSSTVNSENDKTSKSFKALDLTVDQNPDSKGEEERIVSMGGFVTPREGGYTSRVWLDSNYSQIGLAMSRSLGDHAVRGVGVIAEPVVSNHTLREKDEFMIIATDGVWEFLSSQEAVNIVADNLNDGEGSSVACQHLIEIAASKWHENEVDYRDDISAIVVQLKHLWGKDGDTDATLCNSHEGQSIS